MKRSGFLTLLSVAAVATSVYAQPIIIGDFEDGTTQGWFQNGSRSISVIPTPVGWAGNSGSFVMEVDWSGVSGFDWTLGLHDTAQPALFDLANGSGPQVVIYDIYWDPPSDWTGDGWMQWTQIAYNYDGGWTQVGPPTSDPNNIYSYGTLSPAIEGPNEFDFIANGTPLSSGTGFAQLYISTNTGDNDALNPITQGKFYIDNIRLMVPEPTSLALFGLGAALLAIRRRVS